MVNKQNRIEKKRPGVYSFVNGAILTDERVTRQFPFIVFLVVLGMLMIANRYRSEKVIREIEILQGNIDDLRSQSITNSAKLMHMSRPSDVVNRVRQTGLGLDEPIRPPHTIEVSKLKK
jgi:hypothetical protein